MKLTTLSNTSKLLSFGNYEIKVFSNCDLLNNDKYLKYCYKNGKLKSRSNFNSLRKNTSTQYYINENKNITMDFKQKTYYSFLNNIMLHCDFNFNVLEFSGTFGITKETAIKNLKAELKRLKANG